MQRAVAAGGDVRHAFERRRRRGQHDRRADQARAHHRHVARVVADALFLLERGVVLLVDHDQAEVGERQEQRRARADHDADAALGDRPPGLAPLEAGQAGMPRRRRAAEAVLEALAATARSARSRAAAPAPAGPSPAPRQSPRNRPRSCPRPARHRAGSPRRRAPSPCRSARRPPPSAPATAPARRARRRVAGSDRRTMRSTASSRPADAIVLTTDVPTPARCASSAAAIAGPSFSASSTRRRAAVSFSVSPASTDGR